MIAAMNRALIICMKEDESRLIEALQKSGIFMPVSKHKITNNDSSKESSKTNFLIKQVSSLSKQNNFFAERKLLSYDKLLDKNEEYLNLKNDCIRTLDSIKEKKQIIAQHKQLIERLYPWKNLASNVEDIRKNNYSSTLTGTVKKKNMKKLSAKLASFGAMYQLVNIHNNTCYVTVSFFNSDQGKILTILKDCEFSENRPDIKSGKVQQKIDNISQEIAKLEGEIEKENSALFQISKELDKLKILFEQEKAQEELNEINFDETSSTVYIEGWIKKSDVKKLKNIAEKNTTVCELEFFDVKQGDDVPTVVENNKFVSQFEVITDMFSTPSYAKADPNPVMAPWYWVIFGLMVGDAGYGLLMLILCLLLTKFIKPRSNAKKLINTITFSSFTTMFWGIMFGSYFGETFMPILFSPLDEPIKMLIFSMVLGVMHIFSGMLIKVYEKIKSGNVLDAIFDEISWIVLITGLALLFLPQSRQIAIYLTIIAVAVIFLTAGRHKKNIFARLATGLTSLYGVTSYVSDILSYSRILALSLATAVVAMVMNMLAQMMSTSTLGFVLSLFVYIIGHAFNLALGLLSAYVHDSRLQYIEFFNKFYEGGGKEFKPISIKAHYFDIKNKN